MKTKLVTVSFGHVTYEQLMFVCPGCVVDNQTGYTGLHSLPVNAEGKTSPQWGWNGDLDRPTLTPSILTHGTQDEEGNWIHHRCHSFLRDGIFEFLSDSTHSLAGLSVPIPDLPNWAVSDSTQEGESNG